MRMIAQNKIIDECNVCAFQCNASTQKCKKYLDKHQLKCFSICHEHLDFGTNLAEIELNGHIVPDHICKLYAEICKACAADYKNAINYEFYRSCAEACDNCPVECIAC